MAMDHSFEERRKYSRIYRNFVFSYREKGKSIAEHNVSQVNNISKGGMNFSSERPLEQGAVITVDLKTSFIADSIILDGIVLECKEKIPGMLYEIRLQFQEVPEQTLTMLGKIEGYDKAEKDRDIEK